MKGSTDTRINNAENRRHQFNTLKTRYQVLSALAMLLTWWVLSVLIGKTYIVPSPVLVLKTLVGLVASSSFYVIISASVLRTLICVILSLVMGIILALCSGYFISVRAFLAPFVGVLRTMPTIVIIVYAIIWLSSNVAPVVITALVTFPIVYANVLEGYDRIDVSLDEVFTLYDIAQKKRLKTLVWPSILPYVKASLISVTSLGLKVMIASEVLSQASPSIGRQFQMARINLETEIVFAWAITTLVISILLEKGLTAFIFKGGQYEK